MSPIRLATTVALTATALWTSACDTSTGSLINDDVQSLLNPPTQQSLPEANSSSEERVNDTENNAADPLRTTTTNAPVLVTSVSSTITIRGDNIVLLIHGENLSDSLTMQLDNESSECLVSELGYTATGSIQTNLIEAECATRIISNRTLRVTDDTGNEVTGSPVTFTGTSITLSTSSNVTNNTNER